MKGKISVLIVLLIFFKTAGALVAQSASDYERKFKEFSKAGFDSLEANHLLNNYFSLLTPFNQVNQLAMGMKGEKWQQFPLESFKSNVVYLEHIDNLIDSPVPDVRLLGYLTIASTGDKTKNARLSEKLKTELSPNCSLWLGMTLMSLGFDRTSSLFPWMVKNNVEAGGYLFPMFTSLSADSLRETAYQFVESDDWNERVYAIQLLINTKYSQNTDKILRNAISTWPLHLKGYAIVPAQKLQLGNMLPLLTPLLDSSRTRRASLQALADSPTEADREFVINLSNQSTSDKDVMASLQSSRYPGMVKHWVLKLENDEVPSDYYFSVYQDTLLKSNELLPAVHKCLRNAQNPKIVSGLLPVLNGRTDVSSQKILLNLIRSTNSSVRASASNALVGTCTDSLKRVLPQVARDSSLCTPFTFDLLIGCGLDTLQNTADYIYGSEVEYAIQLNALKYLTTFPEKRHLTLFRTLINHEDDDGYMIKRMLAKGLAQLNDLASVESIIKVSEKERKGSDWNSISYIEALSRLKVDASKVYISSFLSSKEEDVKKMVTKIIDSW
ncbi:hypothetical protein [Dyadobacter sp. CY312]|uniref:hypothetical protein n=1 Tax=Dyadobacter sp. CY312 TaxID=2907303 RepID=UPI001F2BE48A|nr:hypothetical protein [Dyadobacter sp. CY312]MCE7040695.1 hypothetical protein [Dyadobacter sp. CY312]